MLRRHETGSPAAMLHERTAEHSTHSRTFTDNAITSQDAAGMRHHQEDCSSHYALILH